MTPYERTQAVIASRPSTWLVTGAAGFIGSHLVEQLLRLGQTVVGLDNFSTGNKENLSAVQAGVTRKQWGKFRFVTGDICDPAASKRAVSGVDYVLHQAALGSVPRSIQDPVSSHDANITGFLNVLVAARDARVKRLVYASSSAVYGDKEKLPKIESEIGCALSPYALTKRVNELYADVFARCYGFEAIGLRYFNVFGPRQDPNGPYAAVIPRWVQAFLQRKPIVIYGDGKTTRDFCYVSNVVAANILAATSSHAEAANRVYNIACNERTSLNDLFSTLRDQLSFYFPQVLKKKPLYRPFRPGDIRHSLADISQAQAFLGYRVVATFADGIAETLKSLKKD